MTNDRRPPPSLRRLGVTRIEHQIPAGKAVDISAIFLALFKSQLMKQVFTEKARHEETRPEAALAAPADQPSTTDGSRAASSVRRLRVRQAAPALRGSVGAPVDIAGP